MFAAQWARGVFFVSLSRPLPLSCCCAAIFASFAIWSMLSADYSVTTEILLNSNTIRPKFSHSLTIPSNRKENAFFLAYQENIKCIRIWNISCTTTVSTIAYRLQTECADVDDIRQTIMRLWVRFQTIDFHTLRWFNGMHADSMQYRAHCDKSNR